LNYSTVEAQVDENQTLLKIFVTAFGIAFTANWIFNSVLKPSSLVGVVNVLQGENEALKSKVASLSAQKTQ
jgi:hypothetical protein